MGAYSKLQMDLEAAASRTKSAAHGVRRSFDFRLECSPPGPLGRANARGVALPLPMGEPCAHGVNCAEHSERDGQQNNN